MKSVVYVIVNKATGNYATVSGPRTIPAYTTEGRAKQAMVRHWLSEEEYEVAEFIRKEDN